MRVLIVEDEIAVAQVIKQMIAPIATEIVIATSMEHAISEIQKAECFDLVTLDLRLEDSSVESTIKKISQFKRSGSLVVIISGNYGNQTQRDALTAGADAFFTKPSFIERKNFFSGLRDVAESIIGGKDRKPVTTNLAIAEAVIKKISDHLASDNPAHPKPNFDLIEVATTPKTS